MTNDFLTTLKRMNTLIRMQATGSPKEFATKLSLSESSLYNYIKRLRDDFGAPVIYDFQRGTYRYEVEGHLVLGFKKLHPIDTQEVNGGYVQQSSTHLLRINLPLQII